MLLSVVHFLLVWEVTVELHSVMLIRADWYLYWTYKPQYFINRFYFLVLFITTPPSLVRSVASVMTEWTNNGLRSFLMLVIRIWNGRGFDNCNISCSQLINQGVNGSNPVCWHTPCLSLDASWARATSPGGWIWLAPWSASWISWCRQVASPSLCRPRHCSPGRTLNTACKQEAAQVNKLRGFSTICLVTLKGMKYAVCFLWY